MTGTSRRRASANASSPHGYHATGLPAWALRYGLVASARRGFTASAPAEGRGSVDLVRVRAHTPRAVAGVHGVDRGDLVGGELEVEHVEVLLQSLAPHRLGEDDVAL